MFIPNTTGKLSSRTGKDVFAQASYGQAKTVDCAIVHVKDTVMKTSVRTDSSATRGNAEEVISAAKILFPINVTIKQGDKFEIVGLKLEVIAIEHRNNVQGQHDHNEVDFRRVA